MGEVIVEEVEALPVPAANIVFIVLAHVGGPLMSLPPPDQPLSHAPVPISIADDVREVRGGDRVRYEITVTNTWAAEAPVTVRLTLPEAVVTGIEAHGAAVIANAVAWKRMMAGGERRTYVVSGIVDPAVRRPDLSVTACMQVGTASTCTTDRNEIDTPEPVRRLAWIAAILFGLLAVVGAIWLHKRIQPEPLAPGIGPSSAGTGAELPGGAPSA
jgi:hypothetical protein